MLAVTSVMRAGVIDPGWDVEEIARWEPRDLPGSVFF